MQHLSYGRIVGKTGTCTISDSSSRQITLERGDKTKDLCVCFDEKLNFEEHTQNKINIAYTMLGLIKRNFEYFTIHTFDTSYKSMVRSHLDYCCTLWTLY